MKLRSTVRQLSLCLILVLITSWQALPFIVQADTTGVPDTVAMCLGQDNCARCLTVQMATTNIPTFKYLPAQNSCQKELSQIGGYRRLMDIQSFAYGPVNTLSDPSAIVRSSLSYDSPSAMASGVESGAAGVVLSSMMQQNIYAEQAQGVTQRINNIRDAVQTITARLKESYYETRANLPSFDKATEDRFKNDFNNLKTGIELQKRHLLRIENTKVEELPQRAPVDTPFQTGGLQEEVLREEITRSIPIYHRRPYGIDIGGVLQRSVLPPADQRTSLQSIVIQERAKLDAAVSKGNIAPGLKRELDSQLTVINKLITEGDKNSVILAERAIRDVRSSRQTAEGKAKLREETVVRKNGSMVTIKVTPDKPPSNESLGRVIVRLDYEIGVGRTKAALASKEAASYTGDDRSQRERIAHISKRIIDESINAFYGARLRDAENLIHVGLVLADLAINWVPQLSMARSVYELITGRDLLTGAELSDLELVGRALDIATAGFGKKFLSGYKNVLRIAQVDPVIKTERYRKILKTTERYAEKAAQKGLAKRLPHDRLKHITERHLPGGSEAGTKQYDMVFKDPDEVLDLAVEAVKHPKAKELLEHNGTSYTWRRGNEASIIGYDPNDPKIVSRDIYVLIGHETKQIITTYPLHPDYKPSPRP